MIDASVARRYARALLEVASDGARHEKVLAELVPVAAALASPDVKRIHQDPAHSDVERRALVAALASKAGATKTTADFLQLLVDKQRITSLELILRVYGEMVDEKVGRVRAVVTSALPLGKDDLAKVRNALAAKTGKSVTLEAKVDPAIVGGLIAQVGPTVWDGSIRTQLERLRDQLKQAPL